MRRRQTSVTACRAVLVTFHLIWTVMDCDFLVQHAMTPSSRQRLELTASLRKWCWCCVLDIVKTCELARYIYKHTARAYSVCCQQGATMQLGLTLGNTCFWAGISCCCHVFPVCWGSELTLPLDNNLIFGTEWFCSKYYRGTSKTTAIVLAKTFPVKHPKAWMNTILNLCHLAKKQVRCAPFHTRCLSSPPPTASYCTLKQLNIRTVSMQMQHQYPVYSCLLGVQDDGWYITAELVLD